MFVIGGGSRTHWHPALPRTECQTPVKQYLSTTSFAGCGYGFVATKLFKFKSDAQLSDGVVLIEGLNGQKVLHCQNSRRQISAGCSLMTRAQVPAY